MAPANHSSQVIVRRQIVWNLEINKILALAIVPPPSPRAPPAQVHHLLLLPHTGCVQWWVVVSNSSNLRSVWLVVSTEGVMWISANKVQIWISGKKFGSLSVENSKGWLMGLYSLCLIAWSKTLALAPSSPFKTSHFLDRWIFELIANSHRKLPRSHSDHIYVSMQRQH